MIDRQLVPRRIRAAERVIAGPWLSEIGFEVLCWIPMLRRFLRDNGVPRERVTALTRGGAGAWYSDLCADSVDVLALRTPEQLRAGMEERVAELGVQKQIALTSFERRLLAELEPGELLHPALMYMRWGAYWAGRKPLSWVLDQASFERLPPPPPLDRPLPDDYVAVKAYFSDAFPETQENRAFVRELVAALAERTNVVLLALPFTVDDHAAIDVAAHGAITDAGPWMSPTDNLAVQSRIVADARALVATYGGFSYLGPFLGVDTVSFFSGYHNQRHLDLMHAVQGGLGATLDARPVAELDPRAIAERVAAAVAR